MATPTGTRVQTWLKPRFARELKEPGVPGRFHRARPGRRRHRMGVMAELKFPLQARNDHLLEGGLVVDYKTMVEIGPRVVRDRARALEEREKG